MVDVLQNFTSISEKPGKFVIMAEKHLAKILAVVMILYVVVSFEYTLRAYDYNLGDFIHFSPFSKSTLAAYFLMVVAAFTILYKRDLPTTKVLSIYLLALSISRILANYSYLFNTSTMYFAYGVLLCTVSVNMFFTGLFFFKGIARNRDSVMVTSLLMVFVYVLLLSFYLHYAVDAFQTFKDHLVIVFQALLYLVLFMTLDTYDVHVNTDTGRVDATVRALRARTGAGEKTAISDSEMKVIANGFGNMTGWTKVDDGGPVEYEYRVIISMRDSNAEMLLQKWKGSEKISFTIADSLDGSLVYAKRFLACRYFYDSEDESMRSVRFVDEDGNMLRFHVISLEEVEMLHEEVENEL